VGDGRAHALEGPLAVADGELEAVASPGPRIAPSRSAIASSSQIRRSPRSLASASKPTLPSGSVLGDLLKGGGRGGDAVHL
jgi:hypothetical protein